MTSLRRTCDGAQHTTALKEPYHHVVAIERPMTAKGGGLSPGNLLGISVAGRMLLSMGTVAQRDKLGPSDTVVDIALTEPNLLRHVVYNPQLPPNR